MTQSELSQLINLEFSCWFMIEELPRTWDQADWDFLNGRAESVAEDLARKPDEVGWGQMGTVLLL